MAIKPVRLQLRRSRIKESADHWMTASERTPFCHVLKGISQVPELVSVRFNQAGTLAAVAGAPLDLGDLRSFEVS
jgi:hypothetical protein